MHRKVFIIFLRPAAKWHKHREENYQSQFHPTCGDGAGMLLKLPGSSLLSQRKMRQSRIFVFHRLKFHFLSWAFTFSFGKFSRPWQKGYGSPGGTRFGRIHTVQDSSIKPGLLGNRPQPFSDLARSCEANWGVVISRAQAEWYQFRIYEARSLCLGSNPSEASLNGLGIFSGFGNCATVRLRIQEQKGEGTVSDALRQCSQAFA